MVKKYLQTIGWMVKNYHISLVQKSKGTLEQMETRWYKDLFKKKKKKKKKNKKKQKKQKQNTMIFFNNVLSFICVTFIDQHFQRNEPRFCNTGQWEEIPPKRDHTLLTIAQMVKTYLQTMGWMVKNYPFH